MKLGDSVRVLPNVIALRAGHVGTVCGRDREGVTLSFTDGRMPCFQWFALTELESEDNPACGSQGVDEDGDCVRCGLPVNPDATEHCPPGFRRAEQRLGGSE